MKKIFIDMDGVLADFNAVFSEEKRQELFEKGFFANLEPMFIKEVLEQKFEFLRLKGYQINILSKAVASEFCRKEKLDWLERHAPKFDNVYIVETYESKNLFLESGAILFDDYSKNLSEWKEGGGKAVKVGGRHKDDFAHVRHISELVEVII